MVHFKKRKRMTFFSHRIRSYSKMVSGKASLLYVGAMAVPILVALFVNPLVLALIGAHEYGDLAAAQATHQILIPLLTLGIDVAITRELLLAAGKSGQAISFVRGGVRIAVLAAVGGAGIYSLAWMLTSGPIAVLSILAVLNAATLASLSHFYALYRSRHQVGRFVIMSACMSTLPAMVGFAAMFISEKHTATIYYVGVAIAQAAILVSQYVQLPLGEPINFAGWKSAIQMGTPTVLHAWIVGGVVPACVLVAKHAQSSAAAGQIQLSLLFGAAPVMILGALNNHWAPNVMSKGPEGYFKYVASTLPRMLFASVLIALAAIVGAIWMLPLMAPNMFGSGTSLRTAVIAATCAPLVVAYLARIHRIFIDGQTGRLAAISSLSALITSGVLMTLVNMQVDFFILAGIALPLFYTASAVQMSILAKRAGQPRPPIALTALATLTCGLVAVLTVVGSRGVSSILASITAIIWVCYEFRRKAPSL